MMETIEPAGPEPDLQPGTWRGGAAASGKRTALIACPRCGGVSSLRGHDINADGEVSPSVECPYRGCDWHTFVWLKGWKP